MNILINTGRQFSLITKISLNDDKKIDMVTKTDAITNFGNVNFQKQRNYCVFMAKEQGSGPFFYKR